MDWTEGELDILRDAEEVVVGESCEGIGLADGVDADFANRDDACGWVGSARSVDQLAVEVERVGEEKGSEPESWEEEIVRMLVEVG